MAMFHIINTSRTPRSVKRPFPVRTVVRVGPEIVPLCLCEVSGGAAPPVAVVIGETCTEGGTADATSNTAICDACVMYRI